VLLGWSSAAAGDATLGLRDMLHVQALAVRLMVGDTGLVDTMVGIAIHGVCPHHLVPFRGVAHVAYLPGGRLHGFGRIARLVDAIGHRFTYQEWMTRDIAEALMTHGKARGAACVIEAEQLCLLLGEDRRGDERVVTQAFTGDFESSNQFRREFMRAIS